MMPNAETLSGQLDRSVLIKRFPHTVPAVVHGFIEDLQHMFPSSQIITDPERLLAYSYDATGERYRPDGVVFAQSALDVENAMTASHKAGVYLLARGSSSNLSGGTTPILGGLVLSLAPMKAVHSIDVPNREVTVQPGVINATLQGLLAPLGFFYPPDPASYKISTLGGNVAENSGGPHCVKYGVTTNHILQLEVVLADGSRLRTPTTRDYRVGYDLTGIVTGSEGTMAVITEITADIAPQPEQTATMLAVYPSVDDALTTVSAIIAAQIVPSTLELMDKKSLEVVEPFVHGAYPVGAGAILLMEVDGSPDVGSAQIETIRQLASTGNASDFRVAQSDLEADALWKARRSWYGAAARVAPHLWIQDVTVPRPLLAAMMQETIAIGQRWGFDIFCSAHAGDGNLHPIITYHPADTAEVQRMHQADREILQACVERGGAITGEHGVGLDKLENLALMYGPGERQLMADLKDAFDPEGFLNPMKAVLAPEHRPLPAERRLARRHGQEIWQPTNVEDIQDAVQQARTEQIRLSVGGQFTRWVLVGGAPDTRLTLGQLHQIVDYDRDNLTLEVEAGALARDVAAFLRSDGLDIPSLPTGSADTVGGLVASNARNWRHSYGLGWRDAVLGVEWIDGRGQVLRFGRKTMKNVAGYDVAKLAVGSWGRLGVLSKLILRLQPYASRRLLGYVQESDAAVLLGLAQQLAGKPTRPDGMVVTRMAPNAGRLWFSHDSVGQNRSQMTVEQACAEAGLPVNWLDDSAWEDWEDDRATALNQALAHGVYLEGGGKPQDLGRIVDAVGAAVPVICYPGSGVYEVFSLTDDLPSLPGMSRRLSRTVCWEHPQGPWEDISRRIEQAFDPDSLFSKPRPEQPGRSA